MTKRHVSQPLSGMLQQAGLACDDVDGALDRQAARWAHTVLRHGHPYVRRLRTSTAFNVVGLSRKYRRLLIDIEQRGPDGGMLWHYREFGRANCLFRCKGVIPETTLAATLFGGPDVHAAVGETGAGRLAYGGWAGSSAIALVRKVGAATVWMRLTPDQPVELPFSAAARPVGATPAIKWMLEGKLLYAVTGTTTRLVMHDVEQAGPTLLDPYARGFRLVRDPETLSMAVVATSHRRTVRPIDEHGAMLRGVDVPLATQVLDAASDRAIFIDTDRRSVTRLLVARRRRSAVVVDRLNEALAHIDLPRAIDLKTRGTDGDVLHDWLLLPPSSPARPASRLPLIVNPYPGLAYGAALPNEAGVSRYAVSDNALALVSAGYAVLLPSMPLTRPGNPANEILPRVNAATDAAIATGLVDPERIGLIGHSFGGYTALLVATRSTRYKAIVAANGPYDLIAAHGLMLTHDKLRLDNGISAAASIGWAEGGQAGMGAPPSEAAPAYVAASLMLHLDRVQNPILLIAGDLDIVDVTQGERAFMELYRHGKDARLVRYWGENHTNASPANIRDYWQVIVTFLNEHLQPAMPSRP